MKLAGAVVLYNPDLRVLSNIMTYIDSLDILIAVDNSDRKNNELIKKLQDMKKVIYLDNKGNRGIAHAQNRAARLAIKKQYEWLLTMDQDSYASENMISILLNYIETRDTSDLGIISAYHKKKTDKRNYFLREYAQVQHVMSSGNIINLKAYQEAGGFDNKLFIDVVDFDFCIRLAKAGYRIIVAYKAVLHHNLGVSKMIDNMLIVSHKPIRYYYFIRNALYTEKKYKDDFPAWVKERQDYRIRRSTRAMLYEKEKLKTLYYMIRGYIDFKRGHYGKLK